MLNWEQIAKGNIHPLRVRILEAADLSGEKFSPAALAREWQEPLGNVAYHTRELHKQGLITPAGTKTRRGALEHYYKIAAKARVKTK